MATKTVEMTKSMKGSQNGILVELFEKDKVYDMEESLADVFIRLEVAKPSRKKPAAEKDAE